MRLLSCITFLVCLFTANAQSTFEKHFSDNNYREFSRFIFETSDSGFVIQASIDGPWTNLVLIRTDKHGNVIWEKNYGTDSIQYKTYGMTSTNDGGFVMCGDYQTVLTYPSMDSYLMKVDSNGTLQWFNLYGWTTQQGGIKDHGTIVKTLDNGNIVVEGYTRDMYLSPSVFISGSYWNSYLGIFDPGGNMLDISNIVAKVDSNLWAVRYSPLDIEVINNNIYWLGTSSVWIPGANRLFVSFNENLDTLFTKRSGLDNYYGLSGTQDDHLILFGDSLVTKADTLGNIIWSVPFTGNCRIYDMHEQPDGSFIGIGGKYPITPFDGTISYTYSNNEVYLLKFSSTGSLMWSTVYLPAVLSQDYRGYDILRTKDGGFAFAGYFSNSSWLVKTDSTGQLNFNGMEEQARTTSFDLFPNPASGDVQIIIPGKGNQEEELRLYNALGELVQVSKIHSAGIINIAHLSRGVYYLHLGSTNGTAVKKLIKQ